MSLIVSEMIENTWDCAMRHYNRLVITAAASSSAPAILVNYKSVSCHCKVAKSEADRPLRGRSATPLELTTPLMPDAPPSAALVLLWVCITMSAPAVHPGANRHGRPRFGRTRRRNRKLEYSR